MMSAITGTSSNMVRTFASSELDCHAGEFLQKSRPMAEEEAAPDLSPSAAWVEWNVP